MSRPLLSVIIPTKDNEFYAEKTIKLMAGYENELMEIVVQDNSQNSTLKSLLTDLIKSGNIKYNYIKENLNVVENFNRAIELSSGEYICMIGDDDFVLNEITDIVEWAKSNSISSVVPRIGTVYYWPGVIYKKNKNGNLRIAKSTGEISSYDVSKEFNRLLEAGGIDYLNFNLPKVYHGIVERTKMDEVRRITGSYFSGLVPDIYGVATLSLLVGRTYYVDFPATISGISPKSNSGLATQKKEQGRFEDAPHFKYRKNYEWLEDIPKIFSPETIWAETLLHAIIDMKRSDLLIKFNRELLVERLWLKYAKLFKAINEPNFRTPKSLKKVKFKIFEILKKNFQNNSIILYFWSKKNKVKILREVKNIELSSYLINNLINEDFLKLE